MQIEHKALYAYAALFFTSLALVYICILNWPAQNEHHMHTTHLLFIAENAFGT
jgi:hypothetical protein